MNKRQEKKWRKKESEKQIIRLRNKWKLTWDKRKKESESFDFVAFREKVMALPSKIRIEVII